MTVPQVVLARPAQVQVGISRSTHAAQVDCCGLMPGAKHFVIYPGPYPNYGHGDYLEDSVTTWNADEEYSDNNGGTWVYVTTSEHSIYTMYEAILSSGW